MKYLKVEWVHNFDDEPRVIYSEIDDDNYETRKVESFADNSLSFASDGESSGDTLLSELPLPDFDSLENDDEFVPSEIYKSEFEKVWELAKGSRKTQSIWKQIFAFIKRIFLK